MDAQMGDTPRLPELTVSLDNFRKHKCKCLVYRKGGDCDCTLCMYVIANLRKFLVDIQRWHSALGHGYTLECNDNSSAFVRSLADINMLQQHIFCDRIEVPELTCDRSSKTFRCFKRSCVMGTCIDLNIGGGAIAQRRWGWEATAPKCKLLRGEQPHMWYRYEPTQVGTNKETKQPIMSDEFRPVFGT